MVINDAVRKLVSTYLQESPKSNTAIQFEICVIELRRQKLCSDVDVQHSMFAVSSLGGQD